MFGKDAKKKELIKNLSQIYEQIQREHQISPGDFPDIKKMQVGVSSSVTFNKICSKNVVCLCMCCFITVGTIGSS